MPSSFTAGPGEMSYDAEREPRMTPPECRRDPAEVIKRLRCMTDQAIPISTPANIPATHRCGKCGRPAPYDSTSPSGAHCYICTTCDPRGCPTLVQIGPFNPSCVSTVKKENKQ